MLNDSLRSHLTDKILPFWDALADMDRGGWYGWMDYDLKVNREAHKGCILNSRILWSYATAYRVLGDEKYLAMAKHALAFMSRF